MKLRYEPVITEIDGEYAAVPVGDNAADFHGMLKLNDVGAEILGLLKDDTDPAAVHRALMEKYTDSSEAEIGHALADFLNQLIRVGLLIVP